MHDIGELQNRPTSIKQLAAQGALYSHAKTLFAAQLVLAVPVMILLTFCALAFDKEWFGLPKRDIAHIVGAVGMCLALLDTLLWTPLITRHRETAAKIQQSFDSFVLLIPWDQIAYGQRPDHEDVERWAAKNANFKSFGHSASSKYFNWYRPEVGVLPLDVARVICQRSNCWWDMDVRRRYNRCVYVTGAVLFLVLLAAALSFNLSAEKFFALVVAPLLPFATTAPKLICDNDDAIARLQHIKSEIDGLWERILTSQVEPKELSAFSNQIQAGIFSNRKQNPLVFDWLADRLRPVNEDTIRKSTEQYVAEFNASSQPRH